MHIYVYLDTYVYVHILISVLVKHFISNPLNLTSGFSVNLQCHSVYNNDDKHIRGRYVYAFKYYGRYDILTTKMCTCVHGKRRCTFTLKCLHTDIVVHPYVHMFCILWMYINLYIGTQSAIGWQLQQS